MNAGRKGNFCWRKRSACRLTVVKREDWSVAYRLAQGKAGFTESLLQIKEQVSVQHVNVSSWNTSPLNRTQRHECVSIDVNCRDGWRFFPTETRLVQGESDSQMNCYRVMLLFAYIYIWWPFLNVTYHNAHDIHREMKMQPLTGTCSKDSNMTAFQIMDADEKPSVIILTETCGYFHISFFFAIFALKP